MKNNITTDLAVQKFVTEDKNMAEIIKSAYEQGVYNTVLDNMTTDQLRLRLKVHQNKTFRTHQDEAYIDIYDRELAKRAGHPNEKVAEEIIGRPLHDYEKHLFDDIDHCQKTGKTMIFFKGRGRL